MGANERQVKEVTTEVVYGLDQNPGPAKSIIYALQWLVFSTGLMLLVPIILSQPLGLSPAMIASMTQRILFFSGLACLLQVLIGHRLPIVEGPSGLWWAVFIGLGTTARAMNQDLGALRSSLQTSMLVAGLVIAIIGATGLVGKAMKYFTPVVTGSILVLLTLQLAGGFIRGAMGVGYKGAPISGTATVISIVIMLAVIIVSLKASPFVRSLAALIGVAIGWLTFYALGHVDLAVLKNARLIGAPGIFAWGAPTWDTGVVLTGVIAGVILIGNVVASMIAMARVGGGAQIPQHLFSRGVFFNGVANILGGVGATVGSISYATAAGLVSITGVSARVPFIIFSVILMSMGFVPAIGAALATIPSPVGNAVFIAAMCTLFGFGVKDYSRLNFTNRDMFVLGVSVMAGVGVMFLPATALAAVPRWLSYLLGNGMITGMLVCLLLEHVLLRESLFRPK
ncbi:MAG: purine/pyrimidine permease [Bacillota bacterium]